MNQNFEYKGLKGQSKNVFNRLKTFFLDHLNKIYCAKAHLIERLPEIRDIANFDDLQHVITDTIIQIEKQVKRLDQIYLMINETRTFDNCEGLIGFIEDACKTIFETRQDAILRDMAIISYLTYMESIEAASFDILIIAAKNSQNIEIEDLLSECFKEAKTDRALMLHLLKKTSLS